MIAMILSRNVAGNIDTSVNALFKLISIEIYVCIILVHTAAACQKISSGSCMQLWRQPQRRG